MIPRSDVPNHAIDRLSALLIGHSRPAALTDPRYGLPNIPRNNCKQHILAIQIPPRVSVVILAINVSSSRNMITGPGVRPSLQNRVSARLLVVGADPPPVTRIPRVCQPVQGIGALGSIATW